MILDCHGQIYKYKKESKCTLCNVKYDIKVMTLTRQQSRTDRRTTHLSFQYSSLKKKNEKQTKKSIAEGQRQYEMLAIVSYIALDSPEPAAIRVVLMKNMRDAFSRTDLCIHLDCFLNSEDIVCAIKHILCHFLYHIYYISSFSMYLILCVNYLNCITITVVIAISNDKRLVWANYFYCLTITLNYFTI